MNALMGWNPWTDILRQGPQAPMPFEGYGAPGRKRKPQPFAPQPFAPQNQFAPVNAMLSYGNFQRPGARQY